MRPYNRIAEATHLIGQTITKDGFTAIVLSVGQRNSKIEIVLEFEDEGTLIIGLDTLAKWNHNGKPCGV